MISNEIKHINIIFLFRESWANGYCLPANKYKVPIASHNPLQIMPINLPIPGHYVPFANPLETTRNPLPTERCMLIIVSPGPVGTHC